MQRYKEKIRMQSLSLDFLNKRLRNLRVFQTQKASRKTAKRHPKDHKKRAASPSGNPPSLYLIRCGGYFTNTLLGYFTSTFLPLMIYRPFVALLKR